MKRHEVEANIGRRVRINGKRDLGMRGEMRRYIRDETGQYVLTVDHLSKGGLAIIRDGKRLFPVAPANVDLFEP